MYETAATTATEGMALLGANIKDAQLLPPQTRFDQCVDILNEMRAEKRISSKDYFRIVQLFIDQSEYYPTLFAGMTADLRMEWLMDKELLD